VDDLQSPWNGWGFWRWLWIPHLLENPMVKHGETQGNKDPTMFFQFTWGQKRPKYEDRLLPQKLGALSSKWSSPQYKRRFNTKNGSCDP
jgi:hypothetical protein